MAQWRTLQVFSLQAQNLKGTTGIEPTQVAVSLRGVSTGSLRPCPSNTWPLVILSQSLPHTGLCPPPRPRLGGRGGCWLGSGVQGQTNSPPLRNWASEKECHGVGGQRNSGLK